MEMFKFSCISNQTFGQVKNNYLLYTVWAAGQKIKFACKAGQAYHLDLEVKFFLFAP